MDKYHFINQRQVGYKDERVCVYIRLKVVNVNGLS